VAGVPAGSTATLADLGTGLGDLPRAAARWAARRGIRLVTVGLERSRVAARLAHERGVPCAVGCAGAPPFRDKSVDIILLSQVAHHLTDDSVVRLFRACDRLARRAVIVADLRRGALGPLAFWCGARALGFDGVTVADGMTSLRRGYTARELRALLAAAGVGGTVERRPGYRLVATWRPGTR
jgi:Methylase involved in ubiquinone/menaquinone biosynthesis